MSRATENQQFDCANCGRPVKPVYSGTYRNHCSHCLWSLHVDNTPGDRLATCHGRMRPIGVDFRGKKGFILIHRCEHCGLVGRNRVAPDDNFDAIVALQAPAQSGSSTDGRSVGW
jgi:hypothetical protein